MELVLIELVLIQQVTAEGLDAAHFTLAVSDIITREVICNNVETHVKLHSGTDLHCEALTCST